MSSHHHNRAGTASLIAAAGIATVATRSPEEAATNLVKIGILWVLVHFLFGPLALGLAVPPVALALLVHKFAIVVPAIVAYLYLAYWQLLVKRVVRPLVPGL